MNRLAVFLATTALLSPGTALAQWGNMVPKTHYGPPPPSGCLQGSAFIDGCQGAPSGTIQFPSLLSSYTKRAPWNVAGVDYFVGVPIGTVLSDPSTISIPGVTVNATAHTVTITGSNITLSGINFGLDNGWKVTNSGANNTIENCLFTAGSNQGTGGFDGYVLALNGSGTTTIVNDELNGNNVTVTPQQGALVSIAGSGTIIFEYDYIHNAAGDMLEVGSTNATEFDVEYNVLENAGSLGLAHADVIQYFNSKIASGHIQFNTVYEHGTGVKIDGEGILATYDEGSGETMSNMTERNNTLISLVNVNWGPGVFIENDVGTGSASSMTIHDNYFDPTGQTSSLWYGTGSVGFGTILPTPSAWYNLTNMKTGALIPVPSKTSPNPGFSAYVYPDANGVSPSLSSIYAFVPSPASGNITTGNSVTITLTMNEKTTVSGIPTLSLNSGGTATYVSGSGTKTLTFNYTVGSTDSATTLAVTSVNLSPAPILAKMADDVGNPSVLSPLTNLVTAFAGLSVNVAGSTLSFTSLTAATINATTPGSGAYTGSAPSGLTNVAFGGGCTGSSTVTGFTASGGTWHATFTTPSTACTGTITVTGLTPNTATAISPSAAFTGGGSTAFPGQASNPVGYKAYGSGVLGTTPYPGGAFVSGTSGSPHVYTGFVFTGTTNINCSFCNFIQDDFTNGVGNENPTAIVSGSNILIAGSRFQSNANGATGLGMNVEVTGQNITFSYDSETPLTSFYTSPPGAAWPSAGAGQNTNVHVVGVNAINGSDGYQYGIVMFNSGAGPVTIDHLDAWGFGQDGVEYRAPTTAQMVLSGSWLHDNANESPIGYHSDGVGFMQGTAGPSNVTIQGNTIAAIGNSDGVAWQQATSGYSNLQTIGNFISGFGFSINTCGATNSVFCTNSVVKDNVWGTDIQPLHGPIYTHWSDTTNIWKCNTVEFLAGTTWSSDSATPAPGWNGQYLYPLSNTPSAIDYKGNTSCP